MRGRTLAVGWLILIALPRLGAAQASGDSARGAAADSLRRAGGDSSAAGRPDSVPQASSPTYLSPAAPDPNAPRLPINVGVSGPKDTTLLRACTGMSGGREAPGLLAVGFRTGTADRDRVAAAKAVGGKLAGKSAYGEEYVQLGVGAGPLAAVADRLIRQDPVVRVSPAPCPPQAIVAPAAPAKPADSAAAERGQGQAGQAPGGPVPDGQGAARPTRVGPAPAGQAPAGPTRVGQAPPGQAPAGPTRVGQTPR